MTPVEAGSSKSMYFVYFVNSNSTIPCVGREVDSAIVTRSEYFLSAEDDLVSSISDQPSGGPGVCDVVLKICTLGPEKYQSYWIILDFEPDKTRFLT